MAVCKSEEDCDAGIRMICKDNKCVCNPGDIFLEWPKHGCFSKAQMFSPCEVSIQCITMNPNTYCNPDNGRCTCSINYFYNGRECIQRYDTTNMKAQEVYKAAVVAAACFIVAVVGIFVACIVRRSFCRRDQHLQQTEPHRESDIFSISDEIAALRAVDKPPSYEEVLQIERTFYGIPPPEYTAPINILAAIEATSAISTPSPPYYPTYSSPPDTSSSTEGHSHFDQREYLKNCLEQPTAPKTQDVQNSPMNFLASAEVLPHPPVNETQIETNVPSATPKTITYSHYISSTPPPRLHRTLVNPRSSSTSLPGSPRTGEPDSSHFSQQHSPGLRVLNLPSPLEMEIQKLKSSEVNAPLPSTSVAIDVCSPTSETICDLDANSDNSAYDNLGFVSDSPI